MPLPDLADMNMYAARAQRTAENVLFNSMQIARKVRELYTGPDHVSEWGGFAIGDAVARQMEMRDVCKLATDTKLDILAASLEELVNKL